MKSIFYGSFFFVLILLVPERAFAQFTVQGHVYDAETNTPLPGANVFIANTTKGTSSGLDGSFTIASLPAVRLKLVVQFLGYNTQVFEVLPGEPLLFKVMMQPSSEILSEVVIRARRSSRSEWLANFALFKTNFIGLSANSRLCSFQNPRAISFDNHNQILSAISDSAVVIDNKGLGYRLKFLIEKYELNLILIHIFYQGQVAFEHLTPSNKEEEMQWARNRLKAYYGSEMHFFRALREKKLIEEGFFVRLVSQDKGSTARIADADEEMRVRSDAYNHKFIKVWTLTNYKRILDSLLSTPSEMVLSFKGDLEIDYIHEEEDYNYRLNRYGSRQTTGKRYQQSTMVMLEPKAIVEPVGEVYPPTAVETGGYWSWELVAESLPLDYDPEVDRKILGKYRQAHGNLKAVGKFTSTSSKIYLPKGA